MKNTAVSIIIRTYNEEVHIGECLEKIFNQTFKNVEVIIVDSESTDKTLEIASKYPIKIIKIKKEDFTYGKSLNIGCTLAKGKYLVLISAHAIPVNEYWLEELIRPFEKNVAAVFGHQIPMKNANPLVRRFIEETWVNVKKSKILIHNANCAIKKQVWKNNPFDEKLIAAEDYLWAKKIKKQGLKIKYNSKAEVYHSHNDSFIQTYHRYFQDMYEYIKIIKKPIIVLMYITDAIFNVFLDIRYILRKKENLVWILYSFITFIAKLLACAKCICLLSKKSII